MNIHGELAGFAHRPAGQRVYILKKWRLMQVTWELWGMNRGRLRELEIVDCLVPIKIRLMRFGNI